MIFERKQIDVSRKNKITPYSISYIVQKFMSLLEQMIHEKTYLLWHNYIRKNWKTMKLHARECSRWSMLLCCNKHETLRMLRIIPMISPENNNYTCIEVGNAWWSIKNVLIPFYSYEGIHITRRMWAWKMVANSEI